MAAFSQEKRDAFLAEYRGLTLLEVQANMVVELSLFQTFVIFKQFNPVIASPFEDESVDVYTHILRNLEF